MENLFKIYMPRFLHRNFVQLHSTSLCLEFSLKGSPGMLSLHLEH